jgi:hypothetical protein
MLVRVCWLAVGALWAFTLVLAVAEARGWLG